MKDFIIIGNSSDNPFAIDIAHFCNQQIDISDIISLKNFQNTEFCPRFISDENDLENVGSYLKGKIVIIVSTSTVQKTRNELAMRNLLITRAAKDNGAKEVILLEPDLFYACQDRGPNDTADLDIKRSIKDRKKFDGQPFTALLNAQLLNLAGVNKIITVHNHSRYTQELFNNHFNNELYNLTPVELFADYFLSSGIINTDSLVLCAPDAGAVPFVESINQELKKDIDILVMDKERTAERDLSIQRNNNSSLELEDLENKDIIVFDDMVRTGTTIVKCCRLLKKYKPRKIIFCVTHFHSSLETREKLHDKSIDEIVTTNTIPSILNRDCQGRLRKKIIVLKIECWIGKKIYEILNQDTAIFDNKKLYTIDMSSKNNRWNT